VEAGYEAGSPTPLRPGLGSHNTSDWEFTRRSSATADGTPALQTARDRGAASVRHPGGGVCTAATVAVAGAGGLSWPVELAAVGTGWSRATSSGQLQPGESATVQIVLGVAPSCGVATAAVTKLAGAFESSWDQIHADYEERWQGAFEPHSDTHFGGNWPVLETDDAELARTYYGSLMSMLLVNKQGIDTDMVIEKQPSSADAKAAGGCEGTYMVVSADGKSDAPIQLHAGSGAAAAAAAGGQRRQIIAAQFAGRMHAPWGAGAGELSGATLSMQFDGGGETKRATVSADCARIVWQPAGLGADARATSERAEGCAHGSLRTPAAGYHGGKVWRQRVSFSPKLPVPPAGVHLAITVQRPLRPFRRPF
jgi:hypothetical protein